MKPRLLFVDDEENIRLTLPEILRGEGFEVYTAASVPEALDFINREKFDILLADLNIGQPGDGFTVVSAMRRTQPMVATFILTGYPDFGSALEAIRQQVDDYLTKPADIRNLVTALKAKLSRPRHIRQQAAKRVATILRENSERIIESWLSEVNSQEELYISTLADNQRIDHLPLVIEILSKTLELGSGPFSRNVFQAAAKHGEDRKHYGYTIPMLVQEAGILHRVIGRVLQECLLEIDLSTLITDTMRIGEILNALLEQSIRAFQQYSSKVA